jgi:hypothetical protein
MLVSALNRDASQYVLCADAGEVFQLTSATTSRTQRMVVITGSIADPVFDRNGKKDVAASQLDDVSGEIMDRKLTCAATVPQFPDLDAIEIVDLFAQS